MDKELLKETEIGENIMVSSTMGDDNIEFFVSTYEVSMSYFFSFQEWEEFVKCVNIANSRYKAESNGSEKK
ncbi:MAG: hypothetical protein ACOC5R_02030 [Elusimicrobiota bacterium]